jgi:hypothetical protein
MGGPKYESVHNDIDIGDKIPPSLPLPNGGIPLFGKEGLGEILEDYVGSIMDPLAGCGKTPIHRRSREACPREGGERESIRRPCESREPVFKDDGFPASSAGQALLPQDDIRPNRGFSANC